MSHHRGTVGVNLRRPKNPLRVDDAPGCPHVGFDLLALGGVCGVGVDDVPNLVGEGAQCLFV